MNSNFIAGLREATRLTRTGKIVEAANLIQETLSGVTGTSPVFHPTPHKPKAGKNGTEPATAQSNRPGRMNAELSSHLDVGSAPLRRPLSETISLLKTTREKLKTKKPERKTPHVSIPAGARFLTRSYSSSAGARMYKVYVPAHRAAKSGLIIMLHGCTQSADDFAVGTAMNELAERHGLIVAYPVQSQTANSSLCWNWFNPRDQACGRGEPAIIAGLTEHLITEFRIDRQRVFVAGLSAGGAMAAVMGATYPSLYAGIGIHSGLGYKTASDLMSAMTAMGGAVRQPDRLEVGAAPMPRTIVFHGDADRTVHHSNGKAIAESAKGGMDSWCEEHIPGRSLHGVDYLRSIIRNAAGVAVVEHWSVHGLGHAWSGGNAAGSYTDPRGPDASREMVRFFLEQA